MKSPKHFMLMMALVAILVVKIVCSPEKEKINLSPVLRMQKQENLSLKAEENSKNNSFDVKGNIKVEIEE